MDPSSLLPPDDAASNPQTLLLWMCGLLVLAVLGLYVDSNRRASILAERHREERICDSKLRGDMWRVVREHFTQTAAHAERMSLLLEELKGRIS